MYLYLQIQMRKGRIIYLLGLGLIVYYFIAKRPHRDKRKLPLPTTFFSTCDIPNLPLFHSQSREDVALYERFYKKPPKCHGTIVEMGALDGQLYSISKFFEHYLGWTSILVEANPYSFKKLVNNRPYSIKYNTAICRQEHIEFVGSAAVGGIVKYMSEKHKRIRIPKKSQKIVVNCSRLQSILREITHVDIFILDVEGGELEGLHTMDWNIPVDFWVIELDNTNPEKDRAVSNLLLSKGYLQSKWDIRSACVRGMDCSYNVMFSKHNVGKRIISYSLYGNDQRYIDGAFANVELMPTIYIDWEIYIYHDATVPSNIIDKLKTYHYVKMINMLNSSIINKISWCFLVASETDVERYVIRNIDTRLSLREKAAVDDWITSGKRFHVMRDHPSHSRYPMNSGMWGGTRDAMPNMHSLLLTQHQENRHIENMKFLDSVVWMKAKSSVYISTRFAFVRTSRDRPSIPK